VRILLLNQFYPPDVAPTGQVAHDLARTLAEAGHEVHVLCSQRAYAGPQRYPATEQRDGVQIRRVRAFGHGRGRALGRLADYASFYLLAMGAVLTQRPAPHLVVSLTTPPYLGLIAKAAARLRRTRHAHWVMDLYPDVMRAHGMLRAGSIADRLFGALTSTQYRGASVVLALGPQMERRVQAYTWPGQRTAYVPLWGAASASDEPAGQAIRVERSWEPGRLCLMYSGNMGLGHRFGEFLEAARRLGPAGPRWAFVGDGPRRQEITAFLERGAIDTVQLLPYEPRERLAASLAAADVHLASLSSAWQGAIVPSKIQGSFAAGRPVIFVGPEENEAALWIREAGAGWVVGEGDVDGLVRAVHESESATERLRRGAAASAFARAHFSQQQNCQAIARLLERLAP
jgi:glycosyltransferase involved in cell wall biosynthesis